MEMVIAALILSSAILVATAVFLLSQEANKPEPDVLLLTPEIMEAVEENRLVLTMTEGYLYEKHGAARWRDLLTRADDGFEGSFSVTHHV